MWYGARILTEHTARRRREATAAGERRRAPWRWRQRLALGRERAGGRARQAGSAAWRRPAPVASAYPSVSLRPLVPQLHAQHTHTLNANTFSLHCTTRTTAFGFNFIQRKHHASSALHLLFVSCSNYMDECVKYVCKKNKHENI